MKIVDWSDVQELENMRNCLQGYLIERKIPFLDNPGIGFSFLVDIARPHAFKVVFIDLVSPLQRTVSVQFNQDDIGGEGSYYSKYLVFKIGHPAGRYCEVTIENDADATKDRIYECLDLLFAKASTWDEGKG